MRRSRSKKRFLSVLILLIVLISITIGYSVLSTTLNISGTTNITKPTWDIHFANIAVTSGSVTATTAPTIATGGLKITYAVTLAKPGDFYEFTVDVVNGGTVGAKLSAVPTVSGVSTAQDVYINYTFLHSDGTSPAANETLAAGATKKFRVRVEFDRNITATQLPTQNQALTLTVGMTYEQA